MEWIKGEQLPNGAVKCGDTTYDNSGMMESYAAPGIMIPKELESDFTIKDGWVFMRDANHNGSIYFTAEIAAKYDLHHMKMEEDEYQDDVADGLDPKFTHNWFITHHYATVNGDGEEILNESPFGNCYSEAFVAWVDGVDPSFFKDESQEAQDGIWLKYWCDG